MSSPATTTTVATVTVLDYLRRATDFLAARGVANPRLDAEVLLADVLAVDRVGVYLNYDRPLVPAEVAGYREALRRRGRREPLQHVRGRQEFRSRDFRCDARALVPRGDTETLVEAALDRVRVRGGVVSDAGSASQTPGREELSILDLGTGTGIIAVTLALEVPRARIVATDVSDAALALAGENAARLGAVVEFRTGDLFAPVAGERFDVIVSNPPYVPTAEIAVLEPEVRDYDPRLALDGGVDGLEVIRRIVADAAAQLAPGGALVLELGAGQADPVRAILRDAGFSAIESRRDLGGIERVVMAAG